jgi:hypothetical protein
MSAKTRAYPHNAEALDVAVAAHDFEARGGKPQIGKLGVSKADVGLIDLTVIARNSVAQVMDTN